MSYTGKLADIHTHAEAGNLDEDFEVLDGFYNAGNEYINILAIDYVEFDCDNTLRCLYLKEKFKKMNISVFGSLRYDKYKNFYNTPFLKQAEDMLAMGCDGIKLLEEKPNYRNIIGFGLNSQLYDEMFNMLEERQIPIIAHINDPEHFWDRNKIEQRFIDLGWCYDSPEYMKFDEILGEMLQRLEKNPMLNIIFAHCMYLGERPETLIELMEKYPNISIDLTPGTHHLEFSKRIDVWKQFFKKYSDRIYYGTDLGAYPLGVKKIDTVIELLCHNDEEFPVPHTPEKYNMRGLGLNDDIQKKIFFDNYVNMIGNKIKPVNKKHLLSEINSLYEQAKTQDSSEKMLERLEIMRKDLSD